MEEKLESKSEFEKFIEKAKMTDNYYSNYLIKIIEVLRSKYYHFDVELEKAFKEIRENEKGKKEKDIITNKLAELNKKEKLTAEEIIISELLKEKLGKIEKELKQGDEDKYTKYVKPVQSRDYWDIFDWIRNNFDFPSNHFENDRYRIRSTDRTN